MSLLPAVLLPLLVLIGQANTQPPVPRFDDPSAWAHNDDGGAEIALSADTASLPGLHGLRLRYTDAAPHWSNLTADCTVPPDATALHLTLYKHGGAPNSAMYVWLVEKDRDAWVQQITIEGRAVGEASVGRHDVTLLISAFQFEPRGSGTREMTSTARMLLGCNFGDMDVTVSSAYWETKAAAGQTALPRTASLVYGSGARGHVGILDMGSTLPVGIHTAHAPQALAAALRRLGFGVTLLLSGDLADPNVTSRAHFDVLILPFGPLFPAGARSSFTNYLRSGGSFLSTDGYAFDRLVEWTGVAWVDQGAGVAAAEMARTARTPTGMNTRFGEPGDAVNFSVEQIGVFDPGFALNGVVKLRPAAHGHPGAVDTASVSVSGLTGYSACGLIGDNSAVFPRVYRRWIPVVEALDAHGTLRGTALAVMHNFAGVYAGSSWAFSGFTSGHDLFLKSQSRVELLGDVLDKLIRKIYLHSPKTEFASYHRGERVRVRITAVNFGTAAAHETVVFTACGRDIYANPLLLAPGKSQNIETSFVLDSGAQLLCPIRASLKSSGGVVIDQVDTAACVTDAPQPGPPFTVGWRDNSLTVDGKNTFAIGTNQTGMMFYSPHEDPLVWDNDFRRMESHNIQLLRILHFSPFAKEGYLGNAGHTSLDLANRPDRLCRQMDAIVELAHRHRIAIVLTLHDWLGLGVTDEELQAQADWDRFWATRYRGKTWVLFDVQNEPAVDIPDRPDIRALWNRWLQNHYTSDTALSAAWQANPPETRIGDLGFGKATGAWDDVRASDMKRFEAEILNRWVKANVDGIKAGNPDALVLVGYLPSMAPADKLLGTRFTDISNMHYYGPIDEFPLEFKLIDRRFEGKGFSLGEFGAQESHDSRAQGRDGLQADACVQRFQSVVHYSVGLGAAFIANWDWKEFDEMVFPWGLTQRGTAVSKPWLYTLSQEAKLLSGVERVYEPPKLYLLIPDTHRIGPYFEEIQRALHRSVALLFAQRINFGVLNEESIRKLPADAKALVWPLPYCPNEAIFNYVLDWVKAGGALYFSGELGFDTDRVGILPDRYKMLGLPAHTPLPPFPVSGAAPTSDVIRSTVGKGSVSYAPYPLELRSNPDDQDVYARFVTSAGVDRIKIEPESAPIQAFSQPTRDGGHLYTLIRSGPGSDSVRVTLPACRVTLDLKERGCAFVVINANGDIIAAESDGLLTIAGINIASAQGHFGLVSRDSAALIKSRDILVLPHQNRTLAIFGAAGAAHGQVALYRDDGTQVSQAKYSSTIRFEPGETARIRAAK